MAQSLQLRKDDQTTIINISKNFINNYYKNINEKTINNLIPLLRDYTIFSCQNKRYKGKDILNHFKLLCSKNILFKPNKFDTIHSGARRINILVSGVITFDDINGKKNSIFSEYIHIGQDNHKKFKIQTSILLIN